MIAPAKVGGWKDTESIYTAHESLESYRLDRTVAGLLTCTPALNAAVNAAESEMPVLGYTVPYAIANVLLTLLGPIIVLTV